MTKMSYLSSNYEEKTSVMLLNDEAGLLHYFISHLLIPLITTIYATLIVPYWIFSL